MSNFHTRKNMGKMLKICQVEFFLLYLLGTSEYEKIRRIYNSRTFVAPEVTSGNKNSFLSNIILKGLIASTDFASCIWGGLVGAKCFVWHQKKYK